ncbi:MAG: hypothetical protein WBF58_17845 [Xanthobacteraceae bacterium]
MATETHGDERLESPQVGMRGVLLWAAAFLAILAVAIVLLQAIYYRQVPVQSYPAPKDFPQPHVQTGQRAQLRLLQRAQVKRLTGYRWVDRKAGVLAIPIERAMQILAAEGMQAYAPLAPAQALSSPSAGAERLITPQAAPPPGAEQSKP